MPLIDRAMTPEALEALYSLVVAEDREQGTRYHRSLNWMVLGPEISRLMIGQSFREPTWGEYAALVILIENKEPRLRPVLDYMVDSCPLSTMLAVQKLVEEESEWSHPSQVLPLPRPTMVELLRAYRVRTEGGDRDPIFLGICERLEVAARIEQSSAGRRLKRKKAVKDAWVELGVGGRVLEMIFDFLAGEPPSKSEIVDGLSSEGILTEQVDEILSFLGVSAAGVDGRYRFLDDGKFVPVRAAVRFLTEELTAGMRKRMSELATGARRSLEVDRASFESACCWVVEVVEPAAANTENDIRKFASTCWEGVGC